MNEKQIVRVRKRAGTFGEVAPDSFYSLAYESANFRVSFSFPELKRLLLRQQAGLVFLNMKKS